MRRNMPRGVSQMPKARSPSTSAMASVIMPAGLVKFMNQARGARTAVRSAMVRITGMVRSAKAMPPGPVVSCPSTPCASGTVSSTMRLCMPPTRMAE